MELKVGMVISSIRSPDIYNEIVRFYEKNGVKMVEVVQFSKDDDDKKVIFTEKELKSAFRKKTIFLANFWHSVLK